MADIELVIKMPEEIYKHIMSMQFYIPGARNGKTLLEEILKAIRDGTSLPKGHGRLIDADGLKENINGWYAFMKDICKQPYMTLKQEEIIGKIDIMTPIIEADKEQEE